MIQQEVKEIDELIEKISKISSIDDVLANKDLLIQTTRKYFEFYDLDIFFVIINEMVENYVEQAGTRGLRSISYDPDKFDLEDNMKKVVIYNRNTITSESGVVYRFGLLYNPSDFLIHKCIEELVSGLRRRKLIKEGTSSSKDNISESIKDVYKRLVPSIADINNRIEKLENHIKTGYGSKEIATGDLEKLNELKPNADTVLSLLNDMIDNGIDSENNNNNLKLLKTITGKEYEEIIKSTTEENLSINLIHLVDKIINKLQYAFYDN